MLSLFRSTMDIKIVQNGTEQTEINNSLKQNYIRIQPVIYFVTEFVQEVLDLLYILYSLIIKIIFFYFSIYKVGNKTQSIPDRMFFV